MDDFFIEFRDPLFSIIIFFLLVFVITFFSYWWGRYKHQEDSKDLDKFLKNFNSLEDDNEINILVNSGELSEKSWLLIANTYFKNGNYDKSIEIYDSLLKISTLKNSQEIMFLLGQTYSKAGFLERSKQIFLEILKNNPKTVEVLKSLLLIYENLREYKSALDVLESLEELKNDTQKEATYLKNLLILNDIAQDNNSKIKKLLALYTIDNMFTYIVFEYLFRIDAKRAWEYFDVAKSELLIDIFWYMDEKDLNFDIILNNDFLTELYTARGDISSTQKSSIFELNILINLGKKREATLNFEYICNSCQSNYPFAFHRCSSCSSVDSQTIEISLIKDHYRNFNEENNSFQ